MIDNAPRTKNACVPMWLMPMVTILRPNWLEVEKATVISIAL